MWYGEQYAEELGISVEYTGIIIVILYRGTSLLDTLASEKNICNRDICDLISINHPYEENIFFFNTYDCSPPKAKIGKNVLLLQGDEVVVYYLRMSATCRSAFCV